MVDLTDFKEAVNEYAELYHLSLRVLDPPFDIIEDWYSNWPNDADAGVYGVFDEQMALLYIGKANKIGNRLGQHFGRDESGKGGTTKQSGWSKAPRYIATVSVIETWEASSLEEYLIKTLQPPDNKRSKI